jgi:alpha-tubulin suppressor-like RCC1 family protein
MQIEGRVIQIAAGGDKSLALLEDGTVKELIYTAHGSYLYETYRYDRRIIQIYINDINSIVLLEDGTIHFRGFTLNRLNNIPNFGGKRVIQIVSKGSTAFALLEDGTIRGWGNSIDPEQLNIPNFDGIRVIQIDCGNAHSLALLENGTVKVWGSNFRRQTNLPDFGGVKVIKISAGKFHSLALLENGTIKTWGQNDVYLLNQIPSFQGRRVTQISAGEDYSLAITEDGIICGWGINFAERLQIPKFLRTLSPLYDPNIPDFKISEEITMANYKVLKQRIECPQCHQNLKNVLLNCNHAFCETCSSGLTNCPTCAKAIINKTVFHQKYITY